MRVKTSITLPGPLLEEIDRAHSNRSAFLELAARAYLTSLSRRARDAEDARILDRDFELLNAEAEDVLEYQTLPE